MFLAILRDIKSDMDSGKPPENTATADMVQRIKAALLDKPQGQLTVDDVAAAVAAQVEQAIAMDEETAGAFQNFVKQVFEQAGK